MVLSSKTSNDVKSLFMKIMAWNMLPVSYENATKILRSLGLTIDKTKKFLKTLTENDELKIVANLRYRSDKMCWLPSGLHLRYLWELKDDSCEEPKKYQPPYVPFIYQWVFDLRDNMLHWASTGEIKKELRFDLLANGSVEDLLRAMPYSTEWFGFYQKLPADILFLHVDDYADRWHNGLEKTDDALFRQVYMEHPSIPALVRSYSKAVYSFYEYVLCGRIHEIPAQVAPNSGSGFYAHALHAQYHGEYASALKLYRQGMKLEGSSILPRSPFYALAYIVALVREGGLSSRKKMDTLVKKKEMRQENNWLPAYLMLLIALGQETKELVVWIERNYDGQTNMVKALAALLLEHYKLSESVYIDFRPIEKLLEDERFKLLQLEYSCDFASFLPKAASLKEELGLSPLLPAYQKLEAWEIALEKLKAITESPEKKDKLAENGSQTRIIYYVTRWNQIVPRLQKSKNGVSWSKGRNIALATFLRGEVEGMSELDKKVAACVKWYNGGYSIGDIYELGGAKVFSLLAGYPFVYMEDNPDIPVVITKEEPQLVVTQEKDGYRVSCNVDQSASSGMVLLKENDQLYRVVELTGEQRQIFEVLKQSPCFPVQAKDTLADLLGKLGKCMTVHSDLIHNKEALKQIKGSPLVTVQLQPVGDGIKAELFVKPFVNEPPYCKAGEGVGSVIGTVKGKRVQAMRNLKKEKENFAAISRILQKVSGDDTVSDIVYFEDYYQCLDLIEELRERTDISRTEWPEGAKLCVKGLADFPQLNLSLKGAGYWFEVDGELEIDGGVRMKIAELLKKVRESKGRFIALNDSDFLALSNQLRRKLQELDSMLNDKDMKVSRFNAMLLTELEQQGALLEKDCKFEELQRKIEQSGTIRCTVPSTLQTELRTYQLEGFQWMSRLAYWGAGACLADDMGLGKTVQAIALMLSRAKEGASLVVAPASVLLNWQNEITRFAPSLTCHVLHDYCGDREKMIQEADAYDILLTTYGLLTTEVTLLSGRQWNVVLLDEAHFIKNKDTKMSKAAMLLNAGFRLLLTGTPIQNHLSEIWNLFQFANPSLLGTFSHFNEKFIIPIEKAGDKERQKQLKRMLQPFLLRRTKTEVLDELPQKTEIVQKVELSPEELSLYDNLREEALSNLEEGLATPVQALAEITRLRQAACHPALIDSKLELSSSKTGVFLNLVNELIDNNHRALVFSQFTSHLALIRKELDAQGISYLYLDGSTPVHQREKLVKHFQQGEGSLFLISLKAGGTGLNLTAADYVFHLDPWWNPAVEDQASDRAYRIGQTRPVTIYRLIASHTIEEKILLLHQSKKSLADSLLDGSNMAGKLTKEEMLELLKSEF